MEALFREIEKKWIDQVCYIKNRRPVLVLSTHGLKVNAQDSLKDDLLSLLQSNDDSDHLVSVILSLKQNHVYFRLGQNTYDYRPHRGRFSRVAVSDYRLGKTDRCEVLLSLSEYEKSQFFKYLSYINKDRSRVLGGCYPIALTDPDFSVKPFKTEGKLHQNRLLETGWKHNCLTWLTTAPLGRNGENLIDLLGIDSEGIKNETHSYIVEFYRFLQEKASINRAPAMLLWTTEKIETIKQKIESSDDFLTNYYNKDLEQLNMSESMRF